jgi:hypothetical protein
MEDMIPNEGLPKVAAAQPCCVQLEAGKNYAWCTCGLSGRTKYRRMVVSVQEDKESTLL